MASLSSTDARVRRPGVAAHGFTLVELLVAIALISVLASIYVPRFRVSPQTRVRSAARQLVLDLELARTRAMATSRHVQVLIDTSASTYAGYLDDDKDGIFTWSTAEQVAFAAYPTRPLPEGVRVGRGSAGALPGDASSGSVTLPSSRVELDERGLSNPLGTTGTIYLVHRDYPDAVAAVSVSGAASFKVRTFRGGVWR